MEPVWARLQEGASASSFRMTRNHRSEEKEKDSLCRGTTGLALMISGLFPSHIHSLLKEEMGFIRVYTPST